MQFHIEDMTCDGCARSITRAIQSIDAQAEVKADPPTHQLEVTSSASRAQIEAVLRDAGFTPSAA